MLSTHLPPLAGFQGRPTKSHGWIDETATVRLTFSKMQRRGEGSKAGTLPPPLNAEVIGATSQASPAYLCQVTAREQSKEHRSWPHVSVIPRLRKVIGTLHRNLDSPPVISPQQATLSRGGGGVLHRLETHRSCALCFMCNVPWYFGRQLFFLMVIHCVEHNTR